MLEHDVAPRVNERPGAGEHAGGCLRRRMRFEQRSGALERVGFGYDNHSRWLFWASSDKSVSAEAENPEKATARPVYQLP